MAEARTPRFAARRPEESTGFLLWQVTTSWQRAIAAALRPHALTQVQFVLLAGLLWLSRSEGETTQAALARQTQLDPMMTSQVLRSLQARGLVQRTAHSSDNRARTVTLTARGRRLLAQALPAVEGADAQFFVRAAVDRGELNALLLSLAG